jgi:hypothetical protein
MDAGEAKGKAKQLEEESRAAKRSNKNRSDINRLNDDELRERMLKYKRKQ